jgi:hypothetical protein
MATKAEIGAMLALKEKQLADINQGELMAQELIVRGVVTRCKTGGAHQRNPIIRSRQSRRYVGGDTIPLKLKEEAQGLKDKLASISGNSPERQNNFKQGFGAVVSKRTLKEAQKLTKQVRELTSTAKEMLEAVHIEPRAETVPVFKLIKRTKREHYEGARGFKAYSQNSTQLIKHLEKLL